MGGAITADYWAACYSPRYFCVRSVDAYTVRVLSVAEWPWSLAKHGSVFTASQPVHYFAFKVLQG